MFFFYQFLTQLTWPSSGIKCLKDSCRTGGPFNSWKRGRVIHHIYFWGIKTRNCFLSFSIYLITIYEHLPARLIHVWSVTVKRNVQQLCEPIIWISLAPQSTPWRKRDDDLIAPTSRQRAIKVQDDPKRPHSTQQCIKTWVWVLCTLLTCCVPLAQTLFLWSLDWSLGFFFLPLEPGSQRA